jgi:CO dehydrogenase/acetyl-CoA synthase beta subunit
MKTYITLAAIILIAGAGFFFIKKPATIEYIKQVETKEIIVDSLDDRIKKAIAASSTEIEAKAKSEADTAYINSKKRSEREIELPILAQYRKEVEKREAEKQKESVIY